jgi:hypothetical protein
MGSIHLAARSIAAVTALTISPAIFHSPRFGVAAANVEHSVRRAGPAAQAATSTRLARTLARSTPTSTRPTPTSTGPTPPSTRPDPTSTRPATTSTGLTTTSIRPMPGPRRAAERPRQSSSARLQQAQAIADTSRWDWRRAGVVIHASFHPQECCHWGVYDSRDNSIWVGPTAFASAARLNYTVLHELGHAWQWGSGYLDRLSIDMAPWGYHGMAGLEAGADCISVAWGANRGAGHYWACPPAAVRVVYRRLAGDWRS